MAAHMQAGRIEAPVEAGAAADEVETEAHPT
jgi:hypothetical protein